MLDYHKVVPQFGIANLVQISPITGVYNQLITGGYHLAEGMHPMWFPRCDVCWFIKQSYIYITIVQYVDHIQTFIQQFYRMGPPVELAFSCLVYKWLNSIGFMVDITN